MKKFAVIIFCCIITVASIGCIIYSILPSLLSSAEKELKVSTDEEMILTVNESKKLDYKINIEDATLISGIEDTNIAVQKTQSNEIFVVGLNVGETFLNLTFRYLEQKIEEQIKIIVREDIEECPIDDINFFDIDDGRDEQVDNEEQSGKEMGESGEEVGDVDDTDSSEEGTEIEIEGIRGCEIEGREIKITGSICYINIIAEVASKEDVKIESELKVEETQMSGLVYKIEVGGSGRYTLKIKIGNRETEYIVDI